MNKKLKTTITISTAIAGSVLMAHSQEAKANEVVEPTQNDSELVIKTKEGRTTSQDVQNAKAEVETAKQKAEDAKAVVDTKTQKVDKATEKVDKLAEIKKTAENVTDETLQKLEGEITKTTNGKADKEKELANKELSVIGKQSAVESAKESVKDTQNTIAEKTAKSEELKSEIKNFENPDNTLAEKQKERAELQNKVNDLRKVQDEKAKAVKDAYEKDKAITDEIDRTSDAMNKQKEVLDNAKADEQTAKAKETEAKSNLDSNAKLFKYGKKDIALSPEFVEGFKKYQKKQITLEELKAIELNALKNKNYIYELDQDGDETVDVNNLSEKDKEEFSQYFVYLLNQIRAQFGLEPRKVNKNTQRFADDVAKYSRTSTYNQMGHDRESIKKAAKDHGLREGQFYENVITSTGSTDAVNYKSSIRTKREIYNDLHNAIFDFFYEGNVNDHYHHAESLLDVDPTTALTFSYKTLVDPDTNENVYHLRLHVISVKLSTVVDKSTAEARYGKTSKDNLEPLKVPSQAELQQAYETAKAEAQTKAEQVKVEQAKYDALVKKMKDYANVVPALNQAQKELEAVNKELDKAQADLAKVVAVIKTLEDQKAVADEKVRELQGQLETVNNEIKALEAELATKEKAVRDAEAKVEDAKAEVATVKDELKAITDKLANLEKEHASALELRDKYAIIVKALEIANEELALAKDELDLAKDELAEAQKLVKANDDELVKVQNRYELEKITYGTTKDAPILEKPEFHFEIPKDAPILEKPEYHFEIPKDAPILEKPEYHFEIPKDAPILEKPEFIPDFALPHDAPILEKPEFHFELPKDAPTVEKPEFDLSTIKDTVKPTVKPTENLSLDKEIARIEKEGTILPKTGEVPTTTAGFAILTLAGAIASARRLRKEK